MCGRYARKSAPRLLAEWFEMELEELRHAVSSWNVTPQSFQPVVRLNPETGRREAPLLRWGLVPAWARDERMGLSAINARSEEAAAKPAFREALKKRRCLVPADAYYEWQKTGPKSRQPFAIAPANGSPMAFAGLWESWLAPTGRPLESFTILTTAANEKLQAIHERMPVIVEREDYTSWLVDEKAAADLLRPLAADRVTSWPVSSRVGNVRNNDAALLDPCQPEESRQGSLF
ncbi:SOS response-associated peptidase [Telmatobacter bradus]|uniref:SOS response-associated peptidase n=1 Tax=Telmatobacter bradus TaxID=474953 RepID=UPI003B436A28